jgi:uncharacterized protein DUF1259
MITALRENGIEVVAIHSHMLEEQPRLFFVHFWANDDALKLANGLQGIEQDGRGPQLVRQAVLVAPGGHVCTWPEDCALN